MRVGSGFDVHAFSDDPGRPLILGGVLVPDAPGLAGHSDADVVAHALIDALLGAAGLGDMGSHFGADDPALMGVASVALLERALSLVEQGWRVSNVDLTIVAQRPRLAPWQPTIQSTLAGLMGLHDMEISVKVTSTDGLGSIGRGEGIACWAVCLLH
ncbi:MAG: 2-C-methyl-D-erythritol 2,4-cyclodiphosphate synthase [Actinobacteria bacterium]|nr:2-C-methyl-D-erythritol 2,4-cyclodiphosphate synthase [Actinomycetota bacterium]